LAENLAQGEGYTVGDRPHAHVPPGYPLLLAGLMRLGVAEIRWLNLAMISMALAALIVAAKLLREQTTSTFGWLAAVTVAVSWEMYHHSVQQLSDIPFMLLVGAGLYAYARGANAGFAWLTIGTFCFVISCWFRVVGIPLALAAGVGLVLQAGRRANRAVWLSVLGLVVGVAATSVFFWHHHRVSQGMLPHASYAHHLHDLAGRSILSWLSQPLVNFYETGSAVARLLTGQRVPSIMALIAFWMPIGIGMWVCVRRGQHVGVVASVGYVGAIMLLRPLIARYLLPVCPLLTLYFLEGVKQLVDMRRAWSGASERVAIGVAAVLIAMNVPKDVRLLRQLHEADFLRLCNETWPALYETADALRLQLAEGEKFVSSTHERTLAYLSKRPPLELGKALTRQAAPAEEILSSLDGERVKVLVFGGGRTIPYFEALGSEVSERHDFELVFDNGRFRMFRWR
jgi:hypothetical protein